MTSDANRREFTRVSSGMEVDLSLADGSEITGYLENISLRGIFVRTSERASPGIECRIILHMAGRGGPFTLEARGFVAHVDQEGLGVCFDEITFEAFERLRNLVFYSADDPTAVEDEFESQLRTRPHE